MKILDTRTGTLFAGGRDRLFSRAAELMEEAGREKRAFSIALTGGSTPKAFYKWAVDGDHITANARSRAVWTVSDERMVPLDSEESNFGNADRMLLTPLGVEARHKFPWPVEVDPHSAAAVFNRKWTDRFGGETGFDLCFLGMGDDGHTASIFPGSPLLEWDAEENFTCVDVPDKGWRLTVTSTGLSRCRRIAVIVTGENKAKVLREVMEGPKPERYPVHILSRFRERTIWLVDDAAASALSGV